MLSGNKPCYITDYTVFTRMVENIPLACFDMCNRNSDMEKRNRKIKTRTSQKTQKKNLNEKLVKLMMQWYRPVLCLDNNKLLQQYQK
jgi:hypothetical protein